MTAHPHEAVVARFYELLADGDPAELLTDEAFVHVGGSNALSGLHRGKEETADVLRRIRDAAPDGLSFDMHDILANDDHGLAIVRVVAERADTTYDEWETHVFELTEGAVAGIFVYWNDPAPADAFFA